MYVLPNLRASCFFAFFWFLYLLRRPLSPTGRVSLSVFSWSTRRAFGAPLGRFFTPPLRLQLFLHRPSLFLSPTTFDSSPPFLPFLPRPPLAIRHSVPVVFFQLPLHSISIDGGSSDSFLGLLTLGHEVRALSREWTYYRCPFLPCVVFKNTLTDVILFSSFILFCSS